MCRPTEAITIVGNAQTANLISTEIEKSILRQVVRDNTRHWILLLGGCLEKPQDTGDHSSGDLRKSSKTVKQRSHGAEKDSDS
ncbi:hypothetical protein MPTK1_8g06790 [Marchantia polymorpha subsp. ruderalis]|uniref:Uncharacterized protein n=1 Tax=Marchantia polymorpha TaxID=3197 RepID=A0A2R6XII7_MARPO|nr:hypothetical protein MARPO_0013s0113 [Marchantia polymorpha]BBN18957.1 hypothetical protein Mp_8g06790 [Marchantia polymorpha subsp. ruderalis]|eukprot:PTQ45889.1 hypothetical protein MARPO_0013s0113 [Marchantia polymorpha]